MKHPAAILLLLFLLLAGCNRTATDFSEARITVAAAQVLGEIDPRVYGHFIENLGRGIYGGVWDQGRVRSDVRELARGLRPPVIRWPGGCFSDCYHWTDGIDMPGRTSRPVEPNCYPLWEILSFTPLDTNEFGTDEFMDFVSDLGADPYIAVNLGSGTAEEAAAWVAYTNADITNTTTIGAGWSQASYWAQMRTDNGHPEPYGVKIWGIGNEIYGGHETGGPYTPEFYVQRFMEYASKMRAVDPSIKLVAVGFDEAWNSTLLSGIRESMDYLSIHVYYPGFPSIVKDDDDSARSILTASMVLEDTLAQVDTTIARVLGPESRVRIALDEWNIWWNGAQLDDGKYALREGLFASLVFNVLHRFSDRVTMANVAQMVNVLGLINTTKSDSYTTPLYHAFRLYRESAGDLRVRSRVEVEGEATKALGNIPAQGYVPFLDASATMDRDGKMLALMVVNRHLSRSIRTRIDIDGFTPVGPLLIRELLGDTVNSRNTVNDKDAVRVREGERGHAPGHFLYTFPAHSATALVMAGRLSSKK